MLAAHGEQPLRDFKAAIRDLTSHRYRLRSRSRAGARRARSRCWFTSGTNHRLCDESADHHKRSGAYTLLFHDTHHRSVTDPDAMSRYDLSGYDGVLAFGESVAEVIDARMGSPGLGLA